MSTRIDKLTIEDFRGWAGTHTLDCDADLVLLVGPNGLGKSSLLEAIVLLMSNQRVHEPPTGTAPDPRQLAFCDRDRWRITSGDATVAWDVSAGPQVLRADLHARKIERLGVEPPLLARATSFFQEDPRGLLDTGAAEHTLADLLRPMSRAVSGLQEHLDAQCRELEAELELLEGREQAEQERNASLFALYERYRALLPGGLPELEASDSLTDAILDHLRAYVDASHGRTPTEPRSLPGHILDLLRQRDAARPTRRRQLLAERALLIARGTTEVATWEKGSRTTLSGILLDLRDHRDRWLATAPALPGLQPLLTELERLDTGTLGSLASSLHALTEEVVRRHERIQAIAVELQQLPEEEEPVVPDELVRLSERLEALLVPAAPGETSPARLRTLLTTLRGLQDHISSLPMQDPQIRTTLEHVINQTLRRFEPRSGFLPVQVVEQSGARMFFELRTADGRTWTDASTGQKAQLSLAFMLAQAQALQEHLPHRVLVLDDTSSAFDQANLIRQTTWLRQLAYSPSPEARWQIFLSSHHDELTSRLVEHLLPPPGRSLRILEFTGWSPERGPEIKPYLLQALRETSAADHNTLARAIQSVWAMPT